MRLASPPQGDNEEAPPGSHPGCPRARRHDRHLAAVDGPANAEPERESLRLVGVVLAMIAFVLIAITISMACAVFAPVWEEFHQAEKVVKAAQAKAPAAEPTAEVQA